MFSKKFCAQAFGALCLLAVTQPAPAVAAPDDGAPDDGAALSEQMLSKLAVDKSKRERSGEFAEAVQALKRAGYIRKRYDAKEDYSEIWRVQKPLDVFGNRVLVVSNEVEGKYIGCCMENRAKILVAATGDVEKLRQFAKSNGCSLDYDGNGEQDSLKETLKKLKVRSDALKFAELNCSANLIGLE